MGDVDVQIQHGLHRLSEVRHPVAVINCTAALGCSQREDVIYRVCHGMCVLHLLGLPVWQGLAYRIRFPRLVSLVSGPCELVDSLKVVPLPFKYSYKWGSSRPGLEGGARTTSDQYIAI